MTRMPYENDRYRRRKVTATRQISQPTSFRGAVSVRCNGGTRTGIAPRISALDAISPQAGVKSVRLTLQRHPRQTVD